MNPCEAYELKDAQGKILARVRIQAVEVKSPVTIVKTADQSGTEEAHDEASLVPRTEVDDARLWNKRLDLRVAHGFFAYSGFLSRYHPEGIEFRAITSFPMPPLPWVRMGKSTWNL